MKMLYGGEEHEVKFKRPTMKAIQQFSKMNDDDLDEEIDFLTLMVKSVDGVAIDDVDPELQWAAMFAAMQVFGDMAQKKSAANGAGPR